MITYSMHEDVLFVIGSLSAAHTQGTPQDTALFHHTFPALRTSLKVVSSEHWDGHSTSTMPPTRLAYDMVEDHSEVFVFIQIDVLERIKEASIDVIGYLLQTVICFGMICTKKKKKNIAILVSLHIYSCNVPGPNTSFTSTSSFRHTSTIKTTKALLQNLTNTHT